MSMYAIKNTDGLYLGANSIIVAEWTEDLASAARYTVQTSAQGDAERCGGRVVELGELIETPKPVVVSDAEAEMLKRAKNTTVWRPASVIAKYAYEHERQADDEVLLEDRLMRAYVNGYTVEKPKRWIVKVPHAKTLIYFKVEDVDDLGVAQSDSEGAWVEFTAAEIEHYGLGDCEKVEASNDKN
ncbi:DUF1642 domain-containing protein [Lacticaseibacillus absianus]|uniref:DUF1642 domain-containing protein n=1 Tax=Lacticaseibacillus absianus TaxID=2729623 RepID=UPI0015CA96B7|nr:DUF1642 domain-containing protein [Lacticaseibacillus absianus]